MFYYDGAGKRVYTLEVCALLPTTHAQHMQTSLNLALSEKYRCHHSSAPNWMVIYGAPPCAENRSRRHADAVSTSCPLFAGRQVLAGAHHREEALRAAADPEAAARAVKGRSRSGPGAGREDETGRIVIVASKINTSLRGLHIC